MTKRDVVIVCGRANNINKNESIKGLKSVIQFVQNRSNTNVIIMNAPHRYDSEETSCVNKEVKVYNRKLNNIMRRYNYTEVTDMSANRGHYTKHGLHMNGTCKDWLARRIANTINKIFVNQELAPIILEWEESSEKREQLKTTGNKESDSGIEQQ
jgi:endonuclease IV